MANDDDPALAAQLAAALARIAELERTNHDLERFNSAVAHDLRAPLHWIDGFSQILVEDHAAALAGDGLGHLQRIREAVAQMGRIIEDLLQLSRISRTELDRQPIDLVMLARSVMTDLGRADAGRRVDLIVPERLMIETDGKLLRIALQHLLGNAWKFTSKLAAARIELGSLDGDAGWFVRDNGAGFDMAHADRLFRAFQRLHGTSEFPGAGLGLAIAHRVIERLGGRMWAEGAVGQGATFYFTVAP